jgi:ribosomal protein L11 methyltransferase
MRALVVTAPASEGELAADALWAMGVLAVEERTAGAGMVELWTALGDHGDGPTRELRWPWRWEHVDDKVTDSWRAFACAVEVMPGLVVAPAWAPAPDDPSAVTIHIEPGSTFGLGDHPTTMLCLRALRRLISPACSLLDVGAGSGVLAVAGRMFGAGRVVATDIAAESVPVGEANAARNGVTGVRFTTDPLGEISGPFDVVVANILAPTLIDLAEQLVAATADVLVVSGLIEGRYQHVVDALAPLHLRQVDRDRGWVALTLRR